MKNKIVEVEWTDAQSGFGNAESVEDLIRDFKPTNTFSTGYLLYEHKEYIILGFMMFGEDMAKHSQLIPTGIIKNIKVIKK